MIEAIIQKCESVSPHDREAYYLDEVEGTVTLHGHELRTLAARVRDLEAALRHYADEGSWASQPGSWVDAQYCPGGRMTASGYEIARKVLADCE